MFRKGCLQLMKPINFVENYSIDLQREKQLLIELASFQVQEDFQATCETLVELAKLYLKAGDIENLLSIIEQLDVEMVIQPTGKFLVFLYYIRAELAYLYSDWTYLVEYCEKGISIAMRNKEFIYIAQFYKMLHQVSFLNNQYEQSRIYCKLSLYFTRRHHTVYQSLIERCQLGLLLLNLIQQKNEDAEKIVNQTIRNQEDHELTYAIKGLIHSCFETFMTNESQQLEKLIDELWAYKQFNLIKYVAKFFSQHVPDAPIVKYLQRFTNVFTITEPIVQHFEKLVYHDQLRAVYIANSNDEKIGYISGEKYRDQLQKIIHEALPEQYITIVTFIIKANDSDLLSRHLKVKFDYYVQIDKDLMAFYPQGARGKYYPTSFCLMFVTDEPVDLLEMGEKCQRYLDAIDLVLEGQKVQYYFFAGASSMQKRELSSLHELYQQADQSLYYATVSQKPIVVYGK